MLQVMQLAGAKDCAVIVSRWFGGIMLHGDRFRIINNQALEVLKANGFIPAKGVTTAPESGRQQKKGKKRR
jgi:putative IMPACT (imprinted ancient) family translation regulator